MAWIQRAGPVRQGPGLDGKGWSPWKKGVAGPFKGPMACLGSSRAGRPAGPGRPLKNESEKYEIVMEIGRGEGLWADF